MKWLQNTALAALVSLGMVSGARAGVIYTFEAPQFTVGESTSILNQSPNVGPATFQADFLSSPTSNAFQIISFQPHSLFSGMTLFEPNGVTGNTLTINFNTPIDAVSLVFSTNGAGRIDLVTPEGSVSQNSTNLGGTFPGGTVAFTSPTPFTTLQLSAFNTGGTPLEFAIDNLTLTPAATAVPEPPSAMMLIVVFGLGGIWSLCGKMRSKSRSRDFLPIAAD